MSFLDRMELIAREKLCAPEQWSAWLFTVANQGGMFITGAICPPIITGKNKGKPNYRKRFKSTECTVYLSAEECK